MIEPCDIILFKSKSFIGDLIAKFSKSKYSHAAIVFDVIFGEPVLLEIDWTKSRLVNLSTFERDYDVYGIKDITDEERKEFKRNVITSDKYLNKGYDYIQLFSTAQKVLFRAESVINRSDKYLCSEIVDISLYDIGINVVKDKERGLAIPEDLADSERTFLKKEVNRRKWGD